MIFIFFLITYSFAQINNCNVVNCTTCVENNSNKCKECKEDSFISQDGLCVLKSKFIGCNIFKSDGCVECNDQYVLVNQYSCMECSSFFPFCNKCEKNVCVECQNGKTFHDLKSDITKATKVCGVERILLLLVLFIVLLI